MSLVMSPRYVSHNFFSSRRNFHAEIPLAVLQLLIPTASVVKVTKEKTARIIPNAVGIATENDKHVFSSLLSRDSTYKLMVQVWKNATAPEIIETVPIEPIPLEIPTVRTNLQGK
jgi:GRAM domain